MSISLKNGTGASGIVLASGSYLHLIVINTATQVQFKHYLNEAIATFAELSISLH